VAAELSFRVHRHRLIEPRVYVPREAQPAALRMEKFVERRNIAHYADQLKTETDPIKRSTLERLLAEEKIQLASTP
jgi:hypothetical protein